MNDLLKKSNIIKNVKTVCDNKEEIPFPQANSFETVLKTLDLIYSDVNTPILIAQCLGFDKRVGKYYADALRYLGLVDKSEKDGNYYLTEEGFVICANFDNQRNEKIFIKIVEHEMFNEIFKEAIKINDIPTTTYICSIMKNGNLGLSDDTLNRRASTVKGWIQWLLDCKIS